MENKTHGLLYGMTTYLVGNIECSNDPFKWRDFIGSSLRDMGVRVLDPTKPILTDQITENDQTRSMLKEWRAQKKFDKIKEFMSLVIRRDLRSVDKSDFIIYNIEPEQPTYGSMHEFVKAIDARKPVICRISDVTKMPMWLVGLVDMSMVFEDWVDLANYLWDINNGSIKPNLKYWKFFLPELR